MRAEPWASFLPALPCSSAPSSLTLFDVANQVSGDVLVVDPARCLVQHYVPSSWGFPVGKGAWVTGRPMEQSSSGPLYPPPLQGLPFRKPASDPF